MEEVIRALSLLFTRYSTLPVRGKFARLREIMLVLTADSSTPSLSLAENFSQLTATEVESFLNLRVDINHN